MKRVSRLIFDISFVNFVNIVHSEGVNLMQRRVDRNTMRGIIVYLAKCVYLCENLYYGLRKQKQRQIF